MEKHTQGPLFAAFEGEWRIRHPGTKYRLEGVVAIVTGEDHPSSKPDAKLIAAAPELYEALSALFIAASLALGQLSKESLGLTAIAGAIVDARKALDKVGGS